MNPNPNFNEDEVRTPFPGPNAPKTQRYKFTADELRVLKECNKESFYQRCLPLSGLFGSMAYLGVKNGHLRPNPRFGATPKVIVGAAIGYFVGKFSYQPRCAEKLMQLPNSQIGEILRQKRRGTLKEGLDSGFGPGMSLAPFGSMSSTDVYTDLSPYSSLNLDTDRPENPGLDDHERPSLDNQIDEEEMPPIQKYTTSYDELRRKNREEYQQKRIGNYREPVVSTAPVSPPSSRQIPDPEFDNRVPPQAPKNKYGDTWG